MKKYIALLWLCCLTVGIRAAVQIKAVGTGCGGGR